MNVGLLMILKWGEATANKISFGDCEANQDRAENIIRRQGASPIACFFQ
jgi:hypothetical protein